MSDVPYEIVREVLSRLSATPLLRFRCVSKSWKDLIDSPQFVKEQLNHSRQTNSNLNFITRSAYIHCADFDLMNETNIATFQVLPHPLKTPNFGTEILGCCDGLLALSNGEEGATVLFNPSTRRFHTLSVTDIEFHDHLTFGIVQFIVYGFGYDCVTDDYKLIRIVQFFGNGNDDFASEVKVYSLKSRSWRRIHALPYYLKYKRAFGELVNGALHWIVTRKVESDTNSLIVAFHIGTEEYKLVPLPKFDAGDRKLNVVVLGGCLGVMCNYHMYDKHVDIWVMKEYGVKESWSILFTVRQSDICLGWSEFLRPLTYSKCGRKVLLTMDGEVIMWYDLENKSVELPMVLSPGKMDFYEVYTCLQSLVLLDGGPCNSVKVTTKKQEKKGKQSLVLLDGGTSNSVKVTTKKQERKGKKKSSSKRDDFLSEGFNLEL